MNLPSVRHYRLGSRAGEGVRCDVDGAFVGETPLLERPNRIWQPRGSAELSDSLSKVYGVPVDFACKTNGLSAVARALNKGDIAHAQLVALHLQLPDPLPLAKSAPPQSDIDRLLFLLASSGVLKANSRHWPAGTPESKGGQFAPKDADLQPASGNNEQSGQQDPTANLDILDDPTRNAPRGSSAAEATEGRVGATEANAVAEAEFRVAESAGARAGVRAAENSAESSVIRLAARRMFREAAVEALEKIGAKLILSEIPFVGVAADVSTIYDIYRFAKEWSELRTAIKAATRFVNEGSHTLAQLRVSRETLAFRDMDAFVKIGPWQ